MHTQYMQMKHNKQNQHTKKAVCATYNRGAGAGGKKKDVGSMDEYRKGRYIGEYSAVCVFSLENYCNTIMTCGLYCT